ncbi:ABC transporter ATP-binding protein [Agromyces soli]
MSGGALAVQGLVVAHDGFRLEASLAVGADETLAVLGPNGSGKSTLLGAIAGHVRPDAGEVRVGARVLGSASSRALPLDRRRVGLLGQRPMLFPHLSALENVAFGPRAQGVARAEARAEARDWIARVGLAGFERRRPAELSGGQQQRIALARVLAARPEALLLDEPFAALDVEAATRMRRLVREQRAALGIPMLLVTHDPIDALVLAGRAAILQQGRLVDDGPIAEVLGHPRTPFVAALAGVNLVSGVLEAGGVARTGSGLRLRGSATAAPAVPAPTSPTTAASAAPVGARVSAVFAPAAVHVRQAGGRSGAQIGTGRDEVARDASAEASVNRWSGTVATLEPAPGGVRLTTDEHPGIAVDVPTAVAVELDLDPGARLEFALADDDVSVRASG